MLERLFPQQADDKLFVEDVFSTWLYTGNGATQTITNGIDLAGKSGLVWIKSRSAATNNFLFDTTRGVNVEINSNTTDANVTLANSVTAFNSNGFAVGSAAGINVNAATYVSWTFRKAPNFFDVVTYTGNGVSGRAISHNLGVAPGVIIVKRTNGATDWPVYHRSLGDNKAMILNSTASVYTWNVLSTSTPTATQFFVNAQDEVNANGGTYVAYLFAHDPSADGIIQCGSYTGDGSATGPVVTLGWEPQWLMVKRAAGGTGNWQMLDNMRGLPVGSADATLQANLSNAETSVDYISPTATGFQVVSTSSEVNTSASTYIYIAIRRGPMRTPTLGTSVFSPNFATSGAPWFKSGFPVDFGIFTDRTNGGNKYTGSRLTGGNFLVTNSTAAQGDDASFMKWDYMNGWRADTTANSNYIGYGFRRAPGFMDVVCYTGTGVVRTVNHNLGVVPELMIVKKRDATTANGEWAVWNTTFTTTNQILILNSSAAQQGSNAFNSTQPTASVFTAANNLYTNLSGSTYVAYLFASVPGVSKVGSYTGNGSSQTINCAFTTGARFVLIKRTDSTGDWYVWDTARGIVSANDPALRLNSTAAETTGIDSVDPDSTGFIVNQDATTNINVNGASYIFLSIA